MVELSNLSTEQVNEKSQNIDSMPVNDILELINDEDAKVALAVREIIPTIAEAVDAIHTRYKAGGRLFYVGSGSSGRMGVLDAAECPPTYGTDPSEIIGVMAGGRDAMFVAVEGAEDNGEQGRVDLAQYELTPEDSVIGIAASGRTPYVLGALAYAKEVGALTIGLSSVKDSPVAKAAEFALTPQTGPEVVTGSTRMKSGTAQKLILNMISTSLMIKEGKVFGNLMVDLKASNEKLVERATRTLCKITNISREEAIALLEKADMHVKTAVAMHWLDCDVQEATRALEEVDGHLSKLQKL